MTRFVTVDEAAPLHPAVLWEDRDGKPVAVGLYGSVEEVPGHGEFEVWTFDVPTTLQVGAGINSGHYPLVDADGAPLWEGARIAFQLPSTHVNTYWGKGSFGTANQYGGHTFTSDEPFPNWGPRGTADGSGTARYSGGGGFLVEGPLKGYRILRQGLGDRHEHGITETFVRLLGDPRGVCSLTFDPAAPAP